jgi:hypothetical protein
VDYIIPIMATWAIVGLFLFWIIIERNQMLDETPTRKEAKFILFICGPVFWIIYFTDRVYAKVTK